MEVKYLKKEDKKVRFKIKGINYSIANAIRRAVLTYLPVMAIDNVTIYENTSPIYEEILVQRIGMIPLTTDLKTYGFKDECKCKGKGCALCEASFVLEKSGPGTLYSGDLKARDAKVKPVHDKIPLVKMAEDQKVKMEMTARLGLMSEHAKFQGALCSYKQLSEEEFEFFVESYNNFSAGEVIDHVMTVLEDKLSELEEEYKAKVLK